MIGVGNRRAWALVASLFVLGLVSGCSEKPDRKPPPPADPIAPPAGATSPQEMLAKLPGESAPAQPDDDPSAAQTAS